MLICNFPNSVGGLHLLCSTNSMGLLLKKKVLDIEIIIFKDLCLENDKCTLINTIFFSLALDL